MPTVRVLRRPILLALPVAMVAAFVDVSSAGGPTTGSASSGAGATAGDGRISTVSTRADLVSGGDALVRVTTPGADATKAHLPLNGRDITSASRQHSAG